MNSGVSVYSLAKRLSAITSIIMLLLGTGAIAEEKPNRIVIENQKRGTLDWMLIKPKTDPPENWIWGPVRCQWIEGYCSKTSVKPGQDITFYVSTNPASEYTIDIYRMGYYGGAGGRWMKQLGPYQGKVQSEPVRDERRNRLMECNWGPGVTLKIPKDWISGVYLGKLTAAVDGIQSYVIFVVRDDRQADFMFQVSDMTWLAYNRWPSTWSLYEDDKKGWGAGTKSFAGFDRPYGKNYERMVQPLSTGSGEFLCWEFHLAFWMEKEGYDVTYVSNVDTHADKAGLLRTKAFISVGHDEYWTQRMYDNVKWAVSEGMGAAFLSGNSILLRCDMEPANTGQPYRVMTPRTAMGSFRHEQDLMGSTSQGTGMAHWVCKTPDHWIYEGTGMKEGDEIKNLVGWEYHGDKLGKIPGLVVVASMPTAPPKDKQKNWGKLRENRPHLATIYTGPKGNIVFNAGTIFWSCGLSKPPGTVKPVRGTFPKVDPRTQRITKNVFDRFAKSEYPAPSEVKKDK